MITNFFKHSAGLYVLDMQEKAMMSDSLPVRTVYIVLN